MNKHKFFNLVVVLIFTFSVFGSPGPVFAQDTDPSIHIWVSPQRDNIQSWISDSSDGTELTLEIDGLIIDTQTITLHPNGGPNQHLAWFDLTNKFDVLPGQVITVSGGGLTKTMTVADIPLPTIDFSADTVSGITTPSMMPWIGFNKESGGYVEREVIPVADTWTADFSILGPGTTGHDLEVYNITPYYDGWVQYNNESNDSTTLFLQGRPPRMEIDIYGNHIFASDWIVDTNVTVSFDIPGSDEEWDYSKTVTVPEGWGAWCQFQIDIDPAEFRIQTGQVVRITDGTTTRQATIPDFSVTSEDPAADTLTGTAVPGSTVNLIAYSDVEGMGFRRNPITDDSGRWSADFAHPGVWSDEQDTFDLIPGTGMFWVSQPINDFVGIKFMWDFGPFFHVFPEEERVETYVWPWGVNLTLTIDDPSTTDRNPDLTRTQENVDWQTNFDNLGTILPGFTVSITDGLVTKTHIVTDLAVTGADSQADTVVGTAAPGSQVDVDACGDNGCAYRHVSAGADRIWLADFSVPGPMGNEQDLFDILPGSNDPVSQPDIDGDRTKLYWRVPNPTFSVLPDEDSMEGNDWPLDSTITIKVGDPNNPDYTTTTTVNAADLDHSQTWFKLDLRDDINLQPGQTVTVSDTQTTKQTIIVPRNITLIDPATDTITGEAEPNIVNVVLWACNVKDCGARIKDVNSDGSWSVNFGIPGAQGWENVIVDIQPETTGGIYQGDADGDGTTYQQWTVTGLPWILKGFYQPVDMNGVYNAVKNGSTVPLKFEIFAGNTELTDVANIKNLTYAQTSCDATAATDEIETITTGGTSLRYVDGQFIYNWQTPKTAGKCYRVTLTTMDGSSLVAYFKLK